MKEPAVMIDCGAVDCEQGMKIGNVDYPINIDGFRFTNCDNTLSAKNVAELNLNRIEIQEKPKGLRKYFSGWRPTE